MKIMICHDGSKKAQVALEKSIAIFRCERPDIILLTVVEEPVDASSHDEEAFEGWRAKREEDLKKTANAVAEKYGLDVDAMLAIGDPRKMIVEAVKSKKPDMLVVARRGGGGVGEEMLFGSVSAYVIRHVTTCPVMITH